MQPSFATLAMIGNGVREASFNDFEANAVAIRTFTKEVFGLGDRLTCFLHLGDKLTYHENLDAGGKNWRTMLVGDKDRGYLRINDHGTGLSGMVSVHMSAFIEVGRIEQIVLDVYPVVLQDAPLSGLIWIDDLLTFGISMSGGSSVIWSADHANFMIPDPSGPINCHSIQGFSMGVVIGDVLNDSLQVIAYLPRHKMMSPVGVSEGRLLDEYVIAPTREIKNPGINENWYPAVQMLFRENIAILNRDGVAVRARRVNSQFTDEEVQTFYLMLRRLAKDGWFNEIVVRGVKYLAPTPQLLFNV